MDDQKKRIYPEKSKRKKLNLTVKREFQIWLIIRIFGVVFISSIVGAVILYFYSHKEISSSFYSAHIHIRRVSDILLPVMVSGALVSLISGTFLALFLPQKIAGPIFRVQKSLKIIKNGDLTEQVLLRSNDILEDLAESVNETTSSLRTGIHEIKAIQQDLELIIRSLEHPEATKISSYQKAALDRFLT